MRLITLVLSLSLSLLSAVSAVATPICHIQRYDESDGLTQWHVTQMAQDSQGMMWFSTWNGLCRFDGYEFRGFKGRVGDGSRLATDRMRSVWLCGDGNLGCRVDDDMYLFNLKRYRFEKIGGMQLRGRNATAVKENRPYRHRDGVGNLWTMYYDGRLTYTPRGGKETPYGDGKSLEAARFCLSDKQGNLWVAATSCIYKICFPRQNGNVVRNGNGAEVKTVFVDRDKRYWIATKEDETVRIFDRGNRLVGYLAPDGRIVAGYTKFRCPIYCITQTRDGSIWLGSKPQGLFRLTGCHGMQAYRIDKIGGLGSDNVYDIKEDRWGRLWIATLGGGVCCVENPRAERPVVVKPFSGLRNYPHTLAKKVRMIHLTKDNVMLCATTDGLLVAKLVAGNDVRNMVFHCHTREANRKDALSCSAVMNVAEDYRGRIFVSTESGGVNMIQTGNLTADKLSFRHYDEANGMPTDVALSVVGVSRKMLMVGSDRLVMFNPDNGDYLSFGKNFFQSECRFSGAIPVRLPDGRWLFGLQDGEYYVAPQQLRKSTFVPTIAFTGVSVQGVEGSCSVNAMDTLVLASNERSFTLRFAALDYSADVRLSYAFALLDDGDEEDVKWNDIGHNHSATLLDLEPGTYVVLVRSTNADGAWVDNVRRLTIVVIPTFWETTPARVLLLLLLLAFFGSAVYTIIYIRRIKRQRREALDAYLNLLSNGTGGDAYEPAPADTPLRPELTPEDDIMMRRVSAFVDEHLGDAEIGVGDMAAAAAMSRSGLQRKMKQIMGVTPLDFLREARMKRACHLLSSTDVPISDVAYSCGYSDPKYFSRSFKASKGKSPKEWRNGDAEG